ncbi:MAG: glycosyltransferase family 4 protein [Parabacteroides sp.]|nr:glycosyltransferase family 4 protein [Parabacteroides sp.]
MIYVSIAFLLFLLELAYFQVARKLNIVDKPNMRSSHKTVTLRGGGIIFYLGGLVYILFFGLNDPWFRVGLTLIAGISLVDDVQPVSGKVRLLFHFAAMLLLFAQWELFGNFPWWYIPIALVFCTGIINAYNFMDGINGITGGYSLAVLAMLAYVNGVVVPFMDADFLYVNLISVLVFNFFNFRTRARCFAGDVGSVSMAFIVLYVLGTLILKTGDLSWIVFLAVYGVDSVLTIVHRLILHENIMNPHRKHAYQLMANELKIPHITVASVYALLQLGISWMFLNFTEYRWYFVATVLLTLSIVYVLFMRRYFHLHTQR